MSSNGSHLLLRAFADELSRCGVAHASRSPGSRSTPIVLALAREERMSAWSHVDEVGVDEAGPTERRWMRSLACRAVWTALEGLRGRVHLNFPLREPLVPEGALAEDTTARTVEDPLRATIVSPTTSCVPGE